MKIIVMLRNPVDRAYSQYNRTIKDDTELRIFEDVINNEIKKLNENKYNTIETKRNESN